MRFVCDPWGSRSGNDLWNLSAFFGAKCSAESEYVICVDLGAVQRELYEISKLTIVDPPNGGIKSDRSRCRPASHALMHGSSDPSYLVDIDVMSQDIC